MDVVVIELDKVADGYALRAELAEREGRTSVPAVYVGGTFIGGCNDGGLGGVVRLNNEGRLVPMLKEVKALWPPPTQGPQPAGAQRASSPRVVRGPCSRRRVLATFLSQPPTPSWPPYAVASPRSTGRPS